MKPPEAASEGRLFDTPTGYTWKQLPGDVFGLGTIVTMCDRCGAIVADHAIHDAWHEAKA